MAHHNALYDRKTDTRPRKLFGAVQALKNTEELIVIAHVESGPIILDAVNRFTLKLLTTDSHAGLLAFGGVFDRIGDQIDPHLPQRRPITRGRRQRFYFDSGGRSGS